MIFEQLLEHVSKIEGDKQYWFVRTDGGMYFETFIEKGFIGIGWNEITIDDLKNKSSQEIKDKLAKNLNLDMSITRSKAKISSIYNKLKRFQGLQQGDIIVIPSNNSSRYAFGMIEDTTITIKDNNEDGCEYYKRKRVKWLEIKSAGQLDPIFFQIKISRHAISNIKRFERHIDNVISNLYLKNGYGYFVLDIQKKEAINVHSLVSFIQSIQVLVEKINSEFGLDEEIDANSIRLNLQSPGKIEFRLPQGKTLVILAAILALSSGCNLSHNQVSATEKKKISEFVEINQDTVNQAQREIDSLEVDRERINSLK